MSNNQVVVEACVTFSPTIQDFSNWDAKISFTDVVGLESILTVEPRVALGSLRLYTGAGPLTMAKANIHRN